MSLLAELQRRNVFRVAVAYGVTAWLTAQVADLAADAFAAPDWVMRMLLVVLVLGFPLAVFLAWVYEMTPDGIRREKDIPPEQSITAHTGHRLTRLTIVVLSLAVVLLLVDKFALRAPTPAADAATEAAAEIDRSIAVLPFRALSSGEDDRYFADGVAEEILNALAQLPQLLVTARTSSFALRDGDQDVREIGEALGVAHVVEGSVRRSGDRVRISAQLVRSRDGFRLWSETFDRTLEDTLAVQDEIAAAVARALDIVLDDEERRLMEQAGTRDVEAFINYQKGLELFALAHGGADQLTTLMEGIRFLDAAIERAPFASAYVIHSDVFAHYLIEDAAGSEPVVDGIESAEAAAEALWADLDAADALAISPQQRADAALVRTLFSADWRRLRALIDDALGGTACVSFAWLHVLQPYVNTRRFAEPYLRLTRCDPLRELGWVQASLALLWIGESDLALATTRDGLERALVGFRLAQARAMIHAAREELEPLEQLADGDPLNRLIHGARTRQPVSIEAILEEFDSATHLYALPAAAMAGAREEANRLASVIDAHPAGPATLVIQTFLCACGAPFDIESTPNLAARLDEAGFDWPPRALIDFPMKDW